jgi:cell division septation protein DedD
LIPVEVSTKERLTGALLVVLALVLIAPELLTGRRAPDRGTPPAQNPEDGPPLQTFSVELDAGGGELVMSMDQPAVAAEMAAVPPPVAQDTAQPAGAAQAAQSPAAADARPAAVLPAEAAGQWWVQVGSYGSRGNAQRVTQELRDAGYAMDMSQMRQNGKDLYRVRAGPVADREAAQALLARLVAAGRKDAKLIPP